MRDAKNTLESFKKLSTKLIDTASRHRVILMILLVGAAVSFALIKTRSFIDVPRNEAKYSEEKLKIRYSGIDQQTLQDFTSAQQDKAVEVNPQFEPNRSNPFSE